MNRYAMIIVHDNEDKLYKIDATDWASAETRATRIFDRTLGEDTWAWSVKPLIQKHNVRRIA